MKSQVVPHGAIKFRENSADSVTFNLSGHTAALPRTLTISRVLPTPRKGNPGTVKIYMNTRRSFLVDVGTANERTVLAISKNETSIPVGIDAAEAGVFIRTSISGIVGDDDGQGDVSLAGRDASCIDLFVQGLLPDQHGDPTA